MRFRSIIRKPQEIFSNRIFNGLHKKYLLKAATTVEEVCPVCSFNWAYTISLIDGDKGEISKNFCKRCGHLYMRWPVWADDFTNVKNYYSKRSEKKAFRHKILLEQAISMLALNEANILDFGVSGNISAIKELNSKYEKTKLNFFASDIVERDLVNYIVAYKEFDQYKGFFNAIISYAVVEHINNTYEAWKNFNSLLKPINEGGGLMLHAFPSQLNYSFNSGRVTGGAHVCIFSKKSLKMMCEQTGFRYVKYFRLNNLKYPVFYFKKIRDI